MQAFVSKTRRPEFELHLCIIDLNNVPLVSGTSFIKWHLPSSTAAEHRGRTPKSTIKDHKVVYDYDKMIPLRLVVGKNQMLQETLIHFEIIQEYTSGGRGERITLGVLDLNLAEYVEDDAAPGADEDDEVRGVTRRYLMHQSKINSTLKLEISMRHVRGDRNYIVPPLRTAPVFGGIAGIMAPDMTDDAYHQQSLPGRSRETGERQDLYRVILAASWASTSGQLKADEVIEDIFAGGDGWGADERKARAEAKSQRIKSSYGSIEARSRPGPDDHQEQAQGQGRSHQTANISNFFRPTERDSSRTRGSRSKHSSGSSSPKTDAVPGRAGLDQQASSLGLTSRPSEPQLQRNEVDEFDNGYRDDLRCWNIRETAAS